MYLFKYCIQNTFFKYFQHTFNILGYFKQPCWSLRVFTVCSCACAVSRIRYVTWNAFFSFLTSVSFPLHWLFCLVNMADNKGIPAILDGKFFSVVKRDEKGNVKAKCMLCSTEKLLSGTVKTTSNFLKHLKVHVYIIVVIIINLHL